MAAKCTKKEKLRRIDELADMIVKGHSQRQLMKHVQSSWGLSVQHSQACIREARDVVKADLARVERVDMLASKIQMLEAMAEKAMREGRENNAIGAIRLLSELVGLAPDKK